MSSSCVPRVPFPIPQAVRCMRRPPRYAPRCRQCSSSSQGPSARGRSPGTASFTVICDLFGVPDHPDHLSEKLGSATDAILNPSVDPESGLVVQAELHSRLTELLSYRRERPAADLTSDLLLPSDSDQEPMPEPVLLDTLFAMIGAGTRAPSTSSPVPSGHCSPTLGSSPESVREPSAGRTWSRRHCASRAR